MNYYPANMYRTGLLKSLRAAASTLRQSRTLSELQAPSWSGFELQTELST